MMALGAQGSTLSGSSLLFAAVLSCVLLVIGAPAEVNSSDARLAGKLKIEGGWSEVKEGWPVRDKDYFLASEKGHHFVETQDLPANLKHDLNVSFVYYYSYSKAKPVLQMTPCTKNIYLVEDGTSEDRSRRWIHYTYKVDRRDCALRSEIAFNVLLHDTGDVFAWKMLKIESIPDEVTDDSPDARETSEAPTTGRASNEAPGPAGSTTEGTTGTSSSEEPASGGPSSASEVSTGKIAESLSRPSLPPVDEDSAMADMIDGVTDESPSESVPGGSTAASPVNASPQVSTGTPSSVEQREETTSSERPASSKPAGLETAVKTKRDQLDEDDPADANLNQRRRKRETPDGTNDGELVNEICMPSSCNKHHFRVDRFSPLVKGLPEKPARAGKFLVNLENKSLKMTVESGDESLAEVDTCVDFLLYMEAGTELELLLSSGQAGSHERLLESIERKTGDSTAGRWDEFRRCISDYMPQYAPSGSGAADRDDWESSMRLVLRPRGTQRPGQMALLVPGQKASYLAVPYPKQSFLPDIKRLESTDDFKRYWIVDRDGLAKPQLSQSSALEGAARGASNEGDRVLRITNIDSSQETFDLTSRWLQVRDAETLEMPLHFEYRAAHADWVDRVDFQFQRAGDLLDEWISQVGYRSPRPLAGATRNSSTEASGQTTTAVTSSASASGSSSTADSRPQPIVMPIHLKGLDSSEFRLRLRHHLRREASWRTGGQTSLLAPLAASAGLALNITSLAFADACSQGRPYCRNEGECRPTGPAQAECVCAQGYSGRFCEHVRPCEVLYTATGGRQLTGDELCRSVGARCVDQLPVMRCEWPNDKYYQCKKLFKLDASGYVPAPIQPQQLAIGASSGGGQSDRPLAADENDATPQEKLNKLQAVVNQQAQLIIILAVFVVAILIFAVVLVGSIVSRLRKSSRRLKKSQGEVHELSRRQIHFAGGSSVSRPVGSQSSIHPAKPRAFGGASSSSATGPSNNRPNKSASPPSVVGYNNSAFDVES